jgi:hypothetical protein
LEEDGIGRYRPEPCTHKIDNKTKQAAVIIINLAVFLFTFQKQNTLLLGGGGGLMVL